MKPVKPGDWIGEEQLEQGIPATATMRVTSEVAIVLVLDAHALQLAKSAATSMGKKSRVSINLDGKTPKSVQDHCDKTKVTNNLLQKKMKKAAATSKRRFGSAGDFGG